MKNKLYKILPAILLIAIVVVGAGMYVRFNGNPFIKVSLNKEAKNYVRQNYPEIADKVQLSPQGVYVGITMTLLCFWRTSPILMIS